MCVIGAGFSGLCMGVKLKKAGIKFRILEQGSEVGGTWTANQYPGCRCDVWSVLYQVNIKNCIQYLKKSGLFGIFVCKLIIFKTSKQMSKILLHLNPLGSDLQYPTAFQ